MPMTEQNGVVVFTNFLKNEANPATSVKGDKTEFKIVDLSYGLQIRIRENAELGGVVSQLRVPPKGQQLVDPHVQKHQPFDIFY